MPKKKYTAAERENMARRTNKRKERDKGHSSREIIYDDEIHPRKGANLECQHSKSEGDLWDWFMAFTVITAALLWFV